MQSPRPGRIGALLGDWIRPAPDWRHWDGEAEALHGISREVLARCGKPVPWVAAELNRRLAGQTGLPAYLQTLQAARELRQRAVQAGLDYQLALTDLERAMGRPLQ